MRKKTGKCLNFDIFLQFCLVVSSKMPTFAPKLLTIKKIIAYRNKLYSNTIK